MNTNLLHKDVQNYLEVNEHQDPSIMALKGSPFQNVTAQELARQLVGKQKAKQKLPTWYACNSIIYPPVLNLEQTSSEITASYKSELVSGKTLVDATGGFGIDSLYFAKKMESVFHCELNASLQELVSFNFKSLGVHNVEFFNSDGIQVSLNQTKLDWLYIDPSRRDDKKRKVFFLEDCQPNVPKIQADCFQITSNILIKTAPILDITIGLKALNFVKQIHIVAVDNEVKELLWILQKGYTEIPEIIACTIFKNKKRSLINFRLDQEKNSAANFSDVASYIYEPYAAVMKSGAFNWLSEKFSVSKLHVNSHIYTSSEKVKFPGKVFKVKKCHVFTKKLMKDYAGEHVNVVTRNFKQTVAQLRKKYKLKEGAERYLFFTTDCNNNPVVIDCLKQFPNE